MIISLDQSYPSPPTSLARSNAVQTYHSGLALLTRILIVSEIELFDVRFISREVLRAELTRLAPKLTKLVMSGRSKLTPGDLSGLIPLLTSIQELRLQSRRPSEPLNVNLLGLVHIRRLELRHFSVQGNEVKLDPKLQCLEELRLSLHAWHNSDEVMDHVSRTLAGRLHILELSHCASSITSETISHISPVRTPKIVASPRSQTEIKYENNRI